MSDHPEAPPDVLAELHRRRDVWRKHLQNPNHSAVYREHAEVTLHELNRLCNIAARATLGTPAGARRNPVCSACLVCNHDDCDGNCTCDCAIARGYAPPREASAAEEPWEFDGECTRCNATMSWEGDPPESPEDAICFACMEPELRLLRAVFAAAKDVVPLIEDKLAGKKIRALGDAVNAALGKKWSCTFCGKEAATREPEQCKPEGKDHSYADHEWKAVDG